MCYLCSFDSNTDNTGVGRCSVCCQTVSSFLSPKQKALCLGGLEYVLVYTCTYVNICNLWLLWVFCTYMNCFLSKLSFGHCKLGSLRKLGLLDFLLLYYIHVQFYLFSVKAVWFSMWNACEMLWAFCCYWCIASKMILFLGESICDGSSRYCFGESFLCTPSVQVWQMGKSSVSRVCVCVCICVRACARACILVCGVVINFREPAHCFLQGTDHRRLLRNGLQNNHCTLLFLRMSSRFFFKRYL